MRLGGWYDRYWPRQTPTASTPGSEPYDQLFAKSLDHILFRIPRCTSRRLYSIMVSIGIQKGPFSLRLAPVVHRGPCAARSARAEADAAVRGGFPWAHLCKPLGEVLEVSVTAEAPRRLDGLEFGESGSQIACRQCRSRTNRRLALQFSTTWSASSR